MGGDPCAMVNSSNAEWGESWLRTPMITVENYTDILLTFNVRIGDITTGSEFTVDIETDEPCNNTVASYDNNTVCQSTYHVFTL